MDISMTLIRIIFFILCTLLSALCALTINNEITPLINLAYGALGGVILASAIVGLDLLFRKFNLRSFNVAVIGMFFGYLLGQVTLTIIFGAIDLNIISGAPIAMFLKAAVYLSAIYLGMALTAHAAEEFYISIPFFKFKSTALKKKDIIFDSSLFNDPRIFDLASSGLLDHQIILPRFVIDELQQQLEDSDEVQKNKARKNLEMIKKLEELPSLELRYCDNDFPEIKNSLEKSIKLAKKLDANIITLDIEQFQQSTVEGIKIIKFQQLCNTLKPLSQTGEFLNIKIQRYGKEPRQGIGYLDDGTMVVINGGAGYIGVSIKTRVLSVKNTSSGRIIFCNALEEDLFDAEYESLATYDNALQESPELEEIHKYHTVP